MRGAISLGQGNLTIAVTCVLADGTTTVACNNSALKSDQGFLAVTAKLALRLRHRDGSCSCHRPSPEQPRCPS